MSENTNLSNQLKPKNIVVCCDGTGNQYGENNTNVVKLFERLVSNESQKIFYDPGVGTSSNALLIPFQLLSNVFTQALGLDLQRNVEDAYYYLMNVYQPGDRIFLFGFSRGAHTVRRLASLIEMCGLLHRGSENMIPYVSRMYLANKSKNIESDPILQGFKKTYTRECPIHFVGVWDTVSAVSSLLPRPKIDGVLRPGLKHAFHAISIDERRLRFPPNLWNEQNLGKDQVVEQVWFAGVHSDVGGFYKEAGLSDISLKWMIDNAIKAGLHLKSDYKTNLNPNPHDKLHESWSGLWWFIPSYLYLVLALATFAIIQWLSVYEPLTYAWELAKESWAWSWLCTVAGFALLVLITQKKRKIPANAKIHKSVKERMDNSSNKYRPSNIKNVIDKVQWVD
ncbi:DUF2235 domain-containing protein [bacterium]|nr:DUF2235 domain-containing protein [bacterium]